MPNVVIGLVGYFQFLRGYPLGPDLKERLEAAAWTGDEIEVREMNWGPIAIVQDFQASATVYDRIVFLTAIDRGLPQGTVTCRRWVGGHLDPLKIQDRVFEAVTGIISLDNLLVIGEHFGIWPDEVITVEVQLVDETFGDMVKSEMAVNHERGEIGVVGEQSLSPEMESVVAKLIEYTEVAVRHGASAMNLEPLSVDGLKPTAEVCHNQFMDDCQSPSASS